MNRALSIFSPGAKNKELIEKMAKRFEEIRG
jgi:hypothetical protein